MQASMFLRSLAGPRKRLQGAPAATQRAHWCDHGAVDEKKWNASGASGMCAQRIVAFTGVHGSRGRQRPAKTLFMTGWSWPTVQSSETSCASTARAISAYVSRDGRRSSMPPLKHRPWPGWLVRTACAGRAVDGARRRAPGSGPAAPPGGKSSPARAPRREGRRVRPAAHRRVPEPAQVLRRAGAGQEHEVQVQFQHPLERQRPKVQHPARPHARPGRVPGERRRVPHVVEAVGGQRGARGRAHVRDERGPSSRPVDASQNMSQDQRAGDVAAVTVQDDRVALVATRRLRALRRFRRRGPERERAEQRARSAAHAVRRGCLNGQALQRSTAHDHSRRSSVAISAACSVRCDFSGRKVADGGLYIKQYGQHSAQLCTLWPMSNPARYLIPAEASPSDLSGDLLRRRTIGG